jgi:hypothetical protein
MSIPPLHMVYWDLDHLRSEEADLNAALFELNRALQSPWSDDLPRAVRELLPVLESYRGLVGTIARNLQEAAKEPEEKSEPEINLTTKSKELTNNKR